MSYGIRSRLVGTYLLIIALTVGLIDAVIIYGINYYYIDNIVSILKTQSENVSNFYSSYLANTELEMNTNKILDNFKTLSVQIQIIDKNGKVIADSIHSSYGEILKYSDLAEATKGKQGYYKGKDNKTGERILSYSTPLKSRDMIVGIIRFTTSLELTYKTIRTLSIYLIIITIGIVFLTSLVSIYLSNTIVLPIKHITKIANEIAKGNFSVRAKKEKNDEIGVLSDTLNYMTEELQKNEKIKNEFISSISHELRTPLTSIKGWIITMQDTEPEDFEVIKRGTYIINNETDRLIDMVEDLLDFSRLQSGKFSLHIEKNDMNALIHSAFEQMLPRASRQNLQFLLEVPQFQDYMNIDSRRIKQVLINLIDNAFKFTKAGGYIKLTGVVILKSEQKFYVITVEDNGCGINKEDLPLIKNRFYRGGDTQNDSGIGLGLSICDELVKSHSGSLEIESRIGEGTRVIVKIPIKS